VSVDDGASMQQSPQSAAAAGMYDTTPPDLFVTIRFQSTEIGRPSSCLQMGGASQLQGLDEAARLAVTRDCASAVRADWQWERVVSKGGGVSLVHTMSARDVAGIAQEGNPRAEQWDICVAGSSSSSVRERTAGHVRGIITLFQHKEGGEVEAEETAAEAEAEVVAPASPAREHRHYDATRPPSRPAPGPGLQRHWEGAALGGTRMERQGDRQVHTDFALVASAETPGAVDIYVDSPVDEAANASLCDSSLNQSSATIGHCNLRSAVSSCEALLTAPVTVLCSVHLPALSNIAIAPELGQLLVQDAGMNGTLSIIGNGCHISPDATAASSMRFMRVDGNDKFAFCMSNLTLSHFGAWDIDGGAVYLQNLLSEDVSSIEYVDFMENAGYDGGALYVTQCVNMMLTSCKFMNNTAADDGGGMFVNSDSSNMTFNSCTFSGNTAIDYGGGLHVNTDNDHITLISCTFSGNTASDSGGGLFVYTGNQDMTITYCIFANNTAESDGGGVYIYNHNDRMTLTSCVVVNNTADYEGGGMFVNGDNDLMKFVSCTFSENTATRDGGGLWVYGNREMALAFCTFSGNTASDDGGGIFVDDGNEYMSLTACTFFGNTATLGGGMSVLSGNVRLLLLSCSFYENTAFIGGGLFINTDNDYMTLTSCTFFGNAAIYDGGGMDINNNNDYMTLLSCTFSENTAHNNGGG
jgi:predicted outer membrane repeat protein